MNHPFWWKSSSSTIPNSLNSDNLSMHMDFLAQHGNQMKHLGDQMPDQNSSSTQSSGQAHQEVSGTSECNNHEQYISAHSGIAHIGGKKILFHYFSPPTYHFFSMSDCLESAFSVCFFPFWYSLFEAWAMNIALNCTVPLFCIIINLKKKLNFYWLFL